VSPATRLVVLAESVSAHDVRAHADASGWMLVGDTPRAHLEMASRRFHTRDGTEVLEVEDHIGAVRSLRITGPSADAIARACEAALPTETPQALHAIVQRGDPVPCIRAAGRLAAGRPAAFDAAHLQAMQRLMTHPEPAVRRAGIRAAYGCRWPELRAWLGARMQVETRLRAAILGLVAWMDELPPA
jgi:hypothetical protein